MLWHLEDFCGLNTLIVHSFVVFTDTFEPQIKSGLIFTKADLKTLSTLSQNRHIYFVCLLANGAGVAALGVAAAHVVLCCFAAQCLLTALEWLRQGCFWCACAAPIVFSREELGRTLKSWAAASTHTYIYIYTHKCVNVKNVNAHVYIYIYLNIHTQLCACIHNVSV